MKHLAASHYRVTIVGDPDQSSMSRITLILLRSSYGLWTVYGWRSAEVENIRKMSTGKPVPVFFCRSIDDLFVDFPGVSYVILEQNYRSSGAILAASVAIVAEGTAAFIALFPCD